MALFRRIPPGAGTGFDYLQAQCYRNSGGGVGYQIAIDEFFGVRTGSISGTAGADGASTGSVGVSGTVAGSAGATGASVGTVGVTGSIAGAAGATGLMVGATGVTGTVSGTGGADGAAVGSVGSTGTAAGAAGASGTMAGLVGVTGSSTGDAGSIGQATGTVSPPLQPNYATVSPGQVLGVRSMNSLGYVVLLSAVDYTVEMP